MLIRADANERIGSGHIMRCLALAQAWRETGRRAAFLAATLSPILEKRLNDEGMRSFALTAQPGTAADADETRAKARQLGAGWIVLDGYQFSSEYQCLIAEADASLLCIDDTAALDRYCADIVLNQNIYAHENLYDREAPFAQLLMGPNYTLLRKEFWPPRESQRDIAKVARKILVTLGGSVDEKTMAVLISGLEKVGSDNIEVVVAAGMLKGPPVHLRGLEKEGKGIRVVENPPDMAALMKWADVAITAAGSTVWECATTGLPMIVMIRSDNQKRVAEGLVEQGIVQSLGRDGELSTDQIASVVGSLLQNTDLRRLYSVKGRQLVDGLGASRVVGALAEQSLTLRKARSDDCRQVWEWANDPQVRQASFSTESIPWDDHIRWFSQKISDPNSLYFIAENSEGQPVGQVRFDLTDAGDAEIHISVERSRRGRGLGSVLINSAMKRVTGLSGLNTVHAMVRPENDRSRAAFLKAGFTLVGREKGEGRASVHLIYRVGDRIRDKDGGLPG